MRVVLLSLARWRLLLVRMVMRRLLLPTRRVQHLRAVYRRLKHPLDRLCQFGMRGSIATVPRSVTSSCTASELFTSVHDNLVRFN